MLRRALSAVLIAGIVLTGVTTMGRGSGAPPVPVVLVHGWDRTPEDAWGWPSGRSGSFYGRLLGHGYGDDHVVCLDWSGRAPDYVSLAGELGELIEQVLASTGAGVVDVVTDCMGALIARALMSAPGYGTKIRNVVMISAPNQGSDWVQYWGQRMLIHHIEARRRSEGRYRAEHAPLWEPPRTDDAEEYVYWRAYYLYEPLFADYVWTERLVPGPVVPAPVDFYGWFRSRHEDSFDEMFFAGRGGLLPLPGQSGPSLPGPETSLDLAYLELLALEAGPHLYRALMSPAEGLVRNWMQDVHPAEDWRQTLVRFVLLRAFSFIRDVGWPWLQFLARDGMHRLATGGAGLGPEFPWPGLVPEAVPWPEKGGPDVLIAANLALARMNERERMSRHVTPEQGPRYTSIVATTGVAPGMIYAGLVGDRGLSLLHVAPGDRVLVLAGNRVDAWRRDVQVAVLDVLRSTRPVLAVDVPWQGRVGALEPVVVRSSGPQDVLVRAGEIPAGHRLAAWREDPAMTPVQMLGEGQEVAVPAGGDLYLQLVSDCARPLDPAHLKRPDHAAVSLLPGGRPPVKVGDAPPAGDPGDGDPGAGSPARGDDGEPPLITVIRTSRLTTPKKERRIVHEWWEWEWGDGEQWIDPQQGVPHGSFRLPAGDDPVTVTARSHGNDGRLLREITWAVGPDGVHGPEGAELTTDGGQRWWAFSVDSIHEPVVLVSIEGPRGWVTGREAVYSVSAHIEPPPYAEEVTVHYYPGQTFRVLWERPGTFTVTAAVNLRFSYRFPERSLYVSVIYVDEIEVEVLATSITR